MHKLHTCESSQDDAPSVLNKRPTSRRLFTWRSLSLNKKKNNAVAVESPAIPTSFETKGATTDAAQQEQGSLPLHGDAADNDNLATASLEPEALTTTKNSSDVSCLDLVSRNDIDYGNPAQPVTSDLETEVHSDRGHIDLNDPGHIDLLVHKQGPSRGSHPMLLQTPSSVKDKVRSLEAEIRLRAEARSNSLTEDTLQSQEETQAVNSSSQLPTSPGHSRSGSAPELTISAPDEQTVSAPETSAKVDKEAAPPAATAAKSLRAATSKATSTQQHQYPLSYIDRNVPVFRIVHCCTVARCIISKGTRRTDVSESKVEGQRRLLVVLLTVDRVHMFSTARLEDVAMLLADRTCTHEQLQTMFNDPSFVKVATIPFTKIVHFDCSPGPALLLSYFNSTTHVQLPAGTSAIMGRSRAAAYRHSTDPFLNNAVLHLESDQALSTLYNRLHRAMDNASSALEWLSQGLPPQREIIPMALLCRMGSDTQASSGGREDMLVLDRCPQYNAAVQLPLDWDVWMQSSSERPVVCVYLHSPLGPLVCHIPPALPAQKLQAQSLSALENSSSGATQCEFEASAELLSSGWCRQAAPGSEDKWRAVLKCRLRCTPLPDPCSTRCPHSSWSDTTGHANHEPSSSVALLLLSEYTKPLVSLAACHSGLVAQLLLALCVWLACCIWWTARHDAPGGLLARALLLFVVSNALCSSYLTKVVHDWLVNGGRERAVWTLTLLHSTLVDNNATAGDEASEGDADENGVNLSLGQFKDVMCQSTWATPAVVEGYIKATGSRAAAYSALTASVQWRAQTAMDAIFSRNLHPISSTIREFMTHSVHCRAKDGNVVIYLNLGEGAENYNAALQRGFSDDDIVEYVAFLLEWVIVKVMGGHDSNLRWHLMLDIKKIRANDMLGPQFRIAKELGLMVDRHYKMRLGQVLVVGAPSWWGVVWSVVQPMLPAEVRRAVAVATSRKKARALLMDILGEDQIPPEYGGRCSWNMGCSHFDQEIMQHMEDRSRGEAAEGIAEETAAETKEETAGGVATQMLTEAQGL